MSLEQQHPSDKNAEANENSQKKKKLGTKIKEGITKVKRSGKEVVNTLRENGEKAINKVQQNIADHKKENGGTLFARRRLKSANVGIDAEAGDNFKTSLKPSSVPSYDVNDNNYKLKQVTSGEDKGLENLVDNDLISRGLDGLYNKGRFDPVALTSLIKSLDAKQQASLADYYQTAGNKPDKQGLPKLIDKIGDKLEDLGIDQKLEQDDFDAIVQIALDPEAQQDTSEGKLFVKIKDLVAQKDYPRLVDIMVRTSPFNTGKNGKRIGGLLGILALGGGLTTLAAGFLGARWYRQGTIKSEAMDSANKELKKGLNKEIANRLEGRGSSTNLETIKLQELNRIFS